MRGRDNPRVLWYVSRIATRVDARHPRPRPVGTHQRAPSPHQSIEIEPTGLLGGTGRYRRLVIADQRQDRRYPLAFLRFAQYAFIRLPIAAFSAAVHTCCFRLVLAFGLGVAVVLGFAVAFRLRFAFGLV